MDKELDAIRSTGKCHHYRIASGIAWLLSWFPEDTTLPTHFENIAALPNQQGCVGIVTAVMKLLRKYSSHLDPVTHSAIFTVLNEALAELSTGTVAP